MSENMREAILTRLAAGREPGAEDAARARVRVRLEESPRNLVPERGTSLGEDALVRFIDQAKAAKATVEKISRIEEIPDRVAGYLAQHNLPTTLRAAPHADLSSLDWSKTTMLDVEFGASDGGDATGITRAAAGVAETGTLVLTSDTKTPTTLNFLPDTHIVVLRASEITGSYEAAWDALSARYGKGRMPRTVNLVTGPSRTADIEQRLIMGAHGPRRLHILIVSENGSE